MELNVNKYIKDNQYWVDIYVSRLTEQETAYFDKYDEPLLEVQLTGDPVLQKHLFSDSPHRMILDVNPTNLLAINDWTDALIIAINDIADIVHSSTDTFTSNTIVTI